MADDDLPDPLAPGSSLPPSTAPDPIPKGDLRVASWVALVGGAIVVVWYLGIGIRGGVYLRDLAAVAQIGIWVIAAVAFVCGMLSLNARRNREFAAAGFIAGVVALLVSLTIGLPAGLQIVL